MLQAYQRVLKMENVAKLKLEQDQKALEKIKNILFLDKEFILTRLIAFLRKELNVEYFSYRVLDLDGNVADILVKHDSLIFERLIKDKQFINMNVEEFIDERRFNNKDEIIITDMSFDENLINLGYLCDSLNYDTLSYSDSIREKLSTFVDYVINKNIYKK